MKSIKSVKKSTWILLGLFVLCIILNVTSWISTSFCDWYREHIFPIWTNSYGRLTSLVPFSFGEILIGMAVVGIPLSVILLIVLLIIKKGKRKKIGRIYGFTYLWIIVAIAMIQTLNCFILYHCSTFATTYNIPQEQYATEQLVELCDYLTQQTNSLSEQVQRNEEGGFVLTADLDETAQAALEKLGEEYPQLAGYYVTPKPIIASYFMSQQYLMGIYFPFTMEANYNDEMYPSNMPNTICHELAHTKGFILEDEASFIAFLACSVSDNVEYQYSGHLSALKYVLSQVRSNCDEETISQVYANLAPGVVADINGNSAYWQSVQESDRGLISSETVAEVSDKAMEASLRLNGVEDGKQSYGRMVDLLINYYFMNKAD